MISLRWSPSVALLFGLLVLGEWPLVRAAEPAAAGLPVEPVATHALVAGFERFFESPAGGKFPAEAAAGKPLSAVDLAAGGRLLLGELSCLSCHAAEGSQAEWIVPKTAPKLSQAGGRIKVAAFKRMLANPHGAKPGTTMPNVLAALPEPERAEATEALLHLLASTGAVVESAPARTAVTEGEALFHSLGCVACHSPRRPAPAAIVDPNAEEPDEEMPPQGPATATYIPLGNVAGKYTLSSLAQFLRDPLAVRPSARMPHFNLKDEEARALASYFFADVKVPANVRYEWFEVGSLDKLPNFAELKAKGTGECSGFDLAVAGRTNNFAVRFTSILHLPSAGDYRFYLGSDDGSRLVIDGKVVVDVDGIHPHQTQEGVAKLAAGPHELVVEYFQGAGEWTVDVEVSGAGLGRQPVAALLSLSREGLPAATAKGEAPFQLDPAKAERGATLFADLGCAACHELTRGDKRIAATKTGPKLAALKRFDAGCLAESPAARLPRYELSSLQKQAIAAALTTVPDRAPTAEETIDRQFLVANCYACHERGGKGGVESIRNAYFESTIKEIGDEGRLPPSLTGAGDKLRPEYLDEIWRAGAKDRPYVKARMPRFGEGNLPGLTAALVEKDQRTEAKLAAVEESENRLKSHGRTLMGDKGLSCVKCHPFNQLVEPGIQAINLNAMHKRLREDWFHRYMLNPPEYRPGTRMPGFYPGGRSVLDSVLGGRTDAQLLAMWAYLKDGSNAAIPPGLVKNPIVLKPVDEPIIYRNFIEGLSPRGIAVGYPEQVNIGFDAERIALGLIWQGPFIDASRHWNDRGVGNQVPLGDNLLSFPLEVPLAKLESLAAPWPGAPAREQGYTFRGYRLDKSQRPTFLYTLPGVAVADFPKPVAVSGSAAGVGTLERQLVLTPDEGASGVVYHRVVRSPKIEVLAEDDAGGSYRTKDGLTLSIVTSPAAKPLVRDSAGQQELLVPVELAPERKVTVTVGYVW